MIHNSFTLDVARLIYAPSGDQETHHLEGDAAPLLPEYKVKAPFTGSVTLTKLEGSIVAHIKNGKTRVIRECSRCLTIFEHDSTIPQAEKEFLIRDLGRPGPEPADDQAVLEVDRSHHHLDLAPFIREELIIALSAIPLCRADCKGLCATCGQNLNEKECGHPREIVDTSTPAESKPLKNLKDLYENFKKSNK